MNVGIESPLILERYFALLEAIQRRMERITQALDERSVPYALVGGQAVALWVATKDPDATRTTKDVDILVRREDLAAVCAAGLSVEMDYCEVHGVGMLLERDHTKPSNSVHLLQANRLHDRVHIIDMIGVGLIGQDTLKDLPPDLAVRLETILNNPER